MFEMSFKAFTTFFATIGPIEAAVLFAGLAPSLTRHERHVVAWKATLIATLILTFFALAGRFILDMLGVSLAALQAAGGAILFLIALDMIFLWEDKSVANITPSETKEALVKEDIAIFPLATPMLAGPGAMSGAMLMMASAGGKWPLQAGVLLALLVVMVLTLVFLLAAKDMHRVVGLTAQKVIQRVFGILLAGLAMQSLFNGIAASGIFAR
jgi:multiple antibiotic resistance protein